MGHKEEGRGGSLISRYNQHPVKAYSLSACDFYENTPSEAAFGSGQSPGMEPGEPALSSGVLLTGWDPGQSLLLGLLSRVLGLCWVI